MRKGTIGSYEDELTENMIEELNSWSTAILESKNVTEEEILNYKNY